MELTTFMLTIDGVTFSETSTNAVLKFVNVKFSTGEFGLPMVLFSARFSFTRSALVTRIAPKQFRLLLTKFYQINFWISFL